MRDEADPPQKHYQLRPTAFERVNAPPPDATAPEASSADSRPADGPIEAKTLARQAMNGQPLLGNQAAPAPLNDVQQLLRDNLDRANAAGINNVHTPTRRPSRRKRDYWLILIPLNGFFATVAFGPSQNPMTFTYGIAGIIVATVGLTWIMWFVMDDYRNVPLPLVPH